MAPTPVTLNNLEDHSQVMALFKCNFSPFVRHFARFQKTQCVARSLGDSWASCKCSPKVAAKQYSDFSSRF